MVRLKVEPEDFVVEEISLYAPSGEGTHTFLWVEKRDVDTERVARALARAAGVAPRDVGYAGRKDRRAVARQWFSVPDLVPEHAVDLEIAGARVLQAVRHPHKLRTGHLAGNRFDLLVRDVGEGEVAAAPAVAAVLRAEGFANRFGAQRFGREGDNAERGLAVLRGDARGRRSRREDRFLISALQAQVFNRVLDERPLPPGRLEWGDVALLHSSGGPFRVEDTEREQLRADAFEISPSGPLFGSRVSVEPVGQPAERERAVLVSLGIPDPLRPPRGVRLRGGRRALRVRPEGLEAHAEGEGLRLRFTLPAGSYATVLVDELLSRSSAEPARVVVE